MKEVIKPRTKYFEAPKPTISLEDFRYAKQLASALAPTEDNIEQQEEDVEISGDSEDPELSRSGESSSGANQDDDLAKDNFEAAASPNDKMQNGRAGLEPSQLVNGGIEAETAGQIGQTEEQHVGEPAEDSGRTKVNLKLQEKAKRKAEKLATAMLQWEEADKHREQELAEVKLLEIRLQNEGAARRSDIVKLEAHLDDLSKRKHDLVIQLKQVLQHEEAVRARQAAEELLEEGERAPSPSHTAPSRRDASAGFPAVGSAEQPLHMDQAAEPPVPNGGMPGFWGAAAQLQPPPQLPPALFGSVTQPLHSVTGSSTLPPHLRQGDQPDRPVAAAGPAQFRSPPQSASASGSLPPHLSSANASAQGVTVPSSLAGPSR